MDEIQKTLKEQLDVLPHEVRRYIGEGLWAQSIGAIGTSFGLDEEQLASLQLEAMLALIALVDFADLPKSIQENVQVAPNDALRIAQAIENALPADIKAALMVFQGDVSDEAVVDETGLTESLKRVAPAAEALKAPSAVPASETKKAEAEKSQAGMAFLDSKLGAQPTPQASQAAAPNPADLVKKYPGNADPYREPAQ